MSAVGRFTRSVKKAWPFEVLPRTPWARQTPTYRQASPQLISAALARSQARPSGNWYVVGASTDIGAKPFGANVAGAELVCWRDTGGEVRIGPAGCPHLGADLCTGTVDRGHLVCPWHGLRLTGRARPDWPSLPTFDDGVLVWARLDRVGGEEPTDAPIVPARPEPPRLAAVTTLRGTCEAVDIIANRMDPWHGAWFHPYSFTQLEVLSAPGEDTDIPEELDRFLVAVTFRIGRLGVPVIAEFTSPEPRTLVMRILDGEGSGSVVETHAVPNGHGRDGLPRATVVEAVVAHSDRPGFARAIRVAPLITPFMRHAANRLWRDDLAYAERLNIVREQKAAGTAELLTPMRETTRADRRPPAAAPGSAPTD
ncbi:DUF5914 domain-containing protein [Mycolicibacterium parafortuitum]|uniref:Rieske (2Fe-2S) domain-containing protein [Saccharomonospora viridis DSM] n=1 Tax=Mycolicibacterium parafortuitum TaxID=39692 RepID=A0A375YRL4_MYCPF|nr:DUF5914 domain-containing protein [Mycolicibacterium parafortuitum]ORB27518.1 2Fe-2S ferredoxin [Mycolicibacterium parafortuitum]SRX83847.1 Rieske (2Fe-2S) domain-containing protein [Saccharomonospora viridis DSM] [Mycolicibacterium parafortuitum]